MRLKLAVSSDFALKPTLVSHGWCMLQPFSLAHDRSALSTVFALADDRAHGIELTQENDHVIVRVSATEKPVPEIRKQIKKAVSDILHLDLDLSPFYRILRKDKHYGWVARRKAGRFLRGQTFFEDVVKMILTTNCSWNLTVLMNRRLVESFGNHGHNGERSFPSPQAIAESSERYLRNHVKLGYRAPYVLELAKRCSRGYDLEAFRSSGAASSELYRELRSIKGVGDYAASNLLKLLGKFDYLGLDSWCRAKYAELYSNSTPVRDGEIERRYEPFQQWRGLALWLDLTKHWYDEKFPPE